MGGLAIIRTPTLQSGSQGGVEVPTGGNLHSYIFCHCRVARGRLSNVFRENLRTTGTADPV